MEPTRTAVYLQSKVLEQIYKAVEKIREVRRTHSLRADNPTRIVGVLGWAGARVVPFWASRRICEVAAESPNLNSSWKVYGSLGRRGFVYTNKPGRARNWHMIREAGNLYFK